MTVVHVGPTDGLASLAAERIKAVKAVMTGKPAAEDLRDKITSDNYLFVASRLRLIKRIFWIIPYRHLDFINAEERVRSFLGSNASPFRQQDIDSMRLENGCVSGTLAAVEVHICSPGTMPPLQEPVLVSIDAGFFPALAGRKGISNLGAIRQFIEFMALKNIGTAAVSVTSSPGLKAMSRYIPEEIATILKNPSMIKEVSPPPLWTVRDQADNMLTGGGIREALRYLDTNAAAFPDDPYLILMRSTAQVLLSRRSAAAGRIIGLCTRNADFCGGITDTGIQLRERGDLPGAEEFFKKALSPHPHLDPARFEYALTLYRSGKHAQADKEARTLLSNPFYAVSSAFLLGDCAYGLKRDEESLRWYEAALKAYRDAGGYRLSGWEQESLNRLKSLYEKRNDQRGLKSLERALSSE